MTDATTELLLCEFGFAERRPLDRFVSNRFVWDRFVSDKEGSR